ncbi:MAG: SurA N-terminal domain-containing protein [Thermodesulfovibrionales bacterium]
MLTFMRKHAKFFYIFFFLIIISFIFFYVGPVDREGAPPVIEVKDETVSYEEYWRAYDNIREFYREVYKEKFDAEMEKKLNLKENVLSELVISKVLYVAAKDAGIEVSDGELRDSIVSDPAFQRDGAFRRDVYLNTLRLNRVTAGYFEAKRREELLIKKMRQLLEASISQGSDDVPLMAGNDQLQQSLREAFESARKEQAVRAFEQT